MKYLKTFEKQKEKEKEKEDIILYKNADFTITVNDKGNMTYFNEFMSKSPIYGMMVEIKNKSKYLNDPELRNIKITEKEKNFAILSLDPQWESNRLKYHSSIINNFIVRNGNKIDVSDISDKAYTALDEMYLPIIEDIIKKSETIGDIIDDFKVLYDELIENLPMYLNMSKFNL